MLFFNVLLCTILYVFFKVGFTKPESISTPIYWGNKKGINGAFIK